MSIVRIGEVIGARKESVSREISGKCSEPCEAIVALVKIRTGLASLVPSDYGSGSGREDDRTSPETKQSDLRAQMFVPWTWTAFAFETHGYV